MLAATSLHVNSAPHFSGPFVCETTVRRMQIGLRIMFERWHDVPLWSFFSLGTTVIELSPAEDRPRKAAPKRGSVHGMNDIQIRPLRASEWSTFKDFRLAALKSAPGMFATSYEEASARSPESWREIIAGPSHQAFGSQRVRNKQDI